MISQNKIPGKSRGVSPVIATVILVAVAITVAVAVSYWMSGIAGQYTSFEKIEISQVTCQDDGYGNWELIIDLKNSGTATATITSIFVNDASATTDQIAPTSNVTTLNTNLATLTPWQLESGEQLPLTLWVGRDYGELSSGTTINIKIHSAAGMDYPKLVKLT